MSIRDPRAAELARELAKQLGTTMTQAIISALEESLQRQGTKKKSSVDEIMRMVREFNEKYPTIRGPLTKDERDAMWGQ